jgi:hypothetical protein
MTTVPTPRARFERRNRHAAAAALALFKLCVQLGAILYAKRMNERILIFDLITLPLELYLILQLKKTQKVDDCFKPRF